MATLHVERTGGLAGFGGARARIRSHGQVDLTTLSAADRTAVDALFHGPAAAEAAGAADGFRFRLTRATPAGTETVVSPEAAVPTAVAACVKDEFV